MQRCKVTHARTHAHTHTHTHTQWVANNLRIVLAGQKGVRVCIDKQTLVLHVHASIHYIFTELTKAIKHTIEKQHLEQA